jgi:hypothetical protein
VHKKFWGKIRRKDTLERPRRRWKNNVKIDLNEIRWKDFD